MAFSGRKWTLTLLLVFFFGVSALPLLADVSAEAKKGGTSEKEVGEKKEKLTIWGDIRFRAEVYDNFNCKGYGENPPRGVAEDEFLLGRFQVGLDYSPTEALRISLGMQHSDAWNDPGGLDGDDFFSGKLGRKHNPYEEPFELYNTFIEIKDILPFKIKAGRQTFSIGNNKLFGPGSWGGVGRWHWDAVRLTKDFDIGFIDAYYGRTKIHDPDEFSLNHHHGFGSYGFYSHFDLPEKLFKAAVEPFVFTKFLKNGNFRGEDGVLGDFDSYYFGFRAYQLDKKAFDWDITLAKQEGSYSNDDYDALGYHLLAAYNWEKAKIKPRLSVEYMVASGDSDPEDGVFETFDGAFGARAKVLGRMNLFFWANIRDLQINFEIKPKRFLYIRAEGHQFVLDESKDAWYLNSSVYRDETGNSGDEVGKELDIWATFKLPQGHQLEVLFGHFWPDEFAENVASSENAYTVYLQWRYKFSIPLLERN